KVWERATPLDPNDRADYSEAARPLRQTIPAEVDQPRLNSNCVSALATGPQSCRSHRRLPSYIDHSLRFKSVKYTQFVGVALRCAITPTVGNAVTWTKDLRFIMAAVRQIDTKMGAGPA